MFLPTIKDGLTEEEAVESLMGFAKRPMDEVKARDFSRRLTSLSVVVSNFFRTLLRFYNLSTGNV